MQNLLNDAKRGALFWKLLLRGPLLQGRGSDTG